MKNKFVSLILKEKIIMISGVCLGFGAFLIYLTFFFTPLYKTSTKLYIRNLPKQDVVASYGGGSTVKSESGYSNPLFNLIELLGSESLSSDVYNYVKEKYPEDLKKLGVSSFETWHGSYTSLITSKVEPSTDVIKISFDWVDPSSAADVLAKTVEGFKKENLKISKLVETQQRSYLDKQLADIGGKLDSIRQCIRNYKISHKAIDLNNESLYLTQARVDLEKQAELLRSQISYQNKKLADLSSQLNMPNARIALRSTAVGQDPYMVSLTQGLSNAQQNYSKLQAKFTDSYPDVIAVKNEIRSIKNNIENRERESLQNLVIKRGIYDTASQNIVTDMARTQAESISLKAQLASLKSGIGILKGNEAKLPEKVLGLQELEKQEDALATAYNNIKQKQLEAKIKENEIVDNIVSLGNPLPPSRSSNTIFAKLISFLSLGFLGALGVVWIKEDVEDKWIDSAEIENVTGEKVLGIIPWVKLQNYLGQGLINKNNPIMEMAYRNIASNIISKSYLEQAQSLVFVSSTDSRGKSFIIPNISATLSKLYRSVIVINTDFLSSAKFLNDLGIVLPENGNDLIDLINEANKCLRLTKDVNNETITNLIKQAIIPVNIGDDKGENISFYYLGINKEVDNIHNYVATQGFNAILNMIKQYYEFVLIDTPAKPYFFPEISAITGASDAVVIISALSTNRQSLVDMIHKLKKSNKKILGVIPREENSNIEKYFSIDKHSEGYQDKESEKQEISINE